MNGSCGEMDAARLLFDRMLVRNVAIGNTMFIIPLTKSGDMKSASDMFDRMPKRSSRSWAAMIAGYVQRKNPKEAVKLYLEMEGVRSMRPNEVTVVSVLAIRWIF